LWVAHLLKHLKIQSYGTENTVDAVMSDISCRI
jgi:hypothetical protein